MKAIIVLDLSDSLINEWDTDTSKCWAEVRVNTPIKGGAHGIGCVYANDNIELKPMPERKYEGNRWTEYYDVAGDYLKAQGYNNCIDEILGEEE